MDGGYDGRGARVRDDGGKLLRRSGDGWGSCNTRPDRDPLNNRHDDDEYLQLAAAWRRPVRHD